MAPFQPPSLNLPDISEVRTRSIIKTIMFPELSWPSQILEHRVVMTEAGGAPFVFIADPEIAATVLAGHEDEFPKARIYDQIVGAGAGVQNLSVASGALWKRLRHAFAPLFRPEGMASLTPLFLSSAENILAGWRDQEGAIIDISRDAEAITFEIVWRLMFGEATETDAPEFVQDAAWAIHRAQRARDMRAIAVELDRTAVTSLRRPPHCPMSAGNPFSRGNADIASAGLVTDLTESELLDNARLLLGAGHETSAPTISWCLWLLGHDLELQDRVHDEIAAASKGEPLRFEHLAGLSQLSSILDECLRLYPPGAITVRRSVRDVTLQGFDFPSGAWLAVTIYALHRHRSLWREPDAFLPGRFAPGAEPLVPSSFIPFSAGRHGCVGATLGRTEVLMILAAILREFRVTSIDVDVRPQMLIVIRPDKEVRLRIQRRLSD